MLFRSLSILTFSLALLACSCAHQVAPGGGPEDRTGPTVMSVTPAQGSVNVDPHYPCTITFSEWISKNSAPKSVSVLPSLDGGAEIHVSGRRLEITPKKTFADSTTYHIVITSALLDLHANAIGSSYTLIFSTGPSLDSGKVIGCVVDPSKRLFQPTVALFRAAGEAEDSVLFTDPDYLTQADSAAFFTIENVRRGTYRLIAFVDQNANHRLDPGTEAAYAPVCRTVTVSPQPDTFRLYPVESDTVAPRLESVKPLSSKLIICKFSRPVDTVRGCSEPLWALERIDKKVNAPAVSERRWFSRRTRCALFLADTLSLAPYRVICSFSRKTGSSAVARCDTVRCNGVAIRDTVPPTLLSTLPVGTVPLLPEICLTFSKPVVIQGPLSLIDTLRDTVRLTADTGYSDSIKLTPRRRLHPGSRYGLLLLGTSGKDMSGNALKTHDSTDTVGKPQFSTIATDSLAVSLKGCAPCLGKGTKRKWQFLPFSGGNPFMGKDSSGCFRFDSLPYGKGNIGYFIDENGNDRPDPGSLVPWVAPEAFFVFPDTVEARARWEIENVTFARPCGQCTAHKVAAAPKEPAGNKKPK
jgi:hypothetical protein